MKICTRCKGTWRDQEGGICRLCREYAQRTTRYRERYRANNTRAKHRQRKEVSS